MSNEKLTFTKINSPDDVLAPEGVTLTKVDKPGKLRSAGDTGLSIARGVATGTKMVADAFGADNVVSRGAGRIADGLGGMRSDKSKFLDTVGTQRMDAAEESGSKLNEFVAGVKNFSDRPVDMLAEGVGSSAPTLAAMAASRGRINPLAGGAGAGAVQGAGSVKGQIYDDVKQRHIAAGLPETDAARRAQEAQSYTGENADQIALGAGLGAVAGTSGAEGAVSRIIGNTAKGGAKSIAANVAAEGATEFAQGGQERLASNIAAQREGFEADTWTGVVGQGTMEGLAGAGSGAVFGVGEAMAGGRPPVEFDPEAGAISKALAQHPDTVPAGRPIIPPPAGLEPAQPIDPIAGQANYAKVIAQSDPMALDKAQGIAAAMNQSAQGAESYTVAPHGDAGFTVVPTTWMSDAQLTSFAAIQGDGGRLPAPMEDPNQAIRVDADGNAMMETPEQMAEVEAMKQRYIDMGVPTPRGTNPNEGPHANPAIPAAEQNWNAGTAVDEAAHQAATSPRNNLPEPTAAQKEAGNYRKGNARIAGMDVAIENPQGSVRRGVSPDGKAWETPLVAHYGYVKGTKAGDGDASDVFIKAGTPDDYNGPVFVIDQVNKDGSFDEHKSVIGVGSEQEARALYLGNYEAGWTGLGAITQMPIDAYKSWVRDGVKRKPLGNITAPQTAAGATSQNGAANGTTDADLAALADTGGEVRSDNGVQGVPDALVLPDGRGVGDAAAGTGSRGATDIPAGQANRNDAVNVIARVGTTPKSAEPVTIRGGVVHIGEAATDITVPEGATIEQIADAMRNGNAVSGEQRIYAGEKGMRQVKASAKPAADTSPAETPEQDRGADRRLVAEMDADTLRRELLTDVLTGLGNRRAYDESEKLPVQIVVDADGLKWVNDNLGHDSGDKLLKAIGQALGDETQNAYHVSGDEFFVQAETEAEAQAIMDRAVARMDGVRIDGTDTDGKDIVLTGVGVSYGIAGDLREAEKQLGQHKSERETQGQRAGRGETPPNAAIGSARGEDQPGDAAAETEQVAREQDDVAAKHAAIDAQLAENREALKGFKVGDEVEFTQPGTYTQRDGTKREGLVVRGKIERIDDAEQGRVKVGNHSVGAQFLKKVEADKTDREKAGAPKIKTAAPDAEAGKAAKPEPDDTQFANNKIFTADKVAAARARLKAKLGTLNSGIDPEVLVDGMTIAGAYIESGIKAFGDYAAAMTADFGDNIKPYLLSFYEGVRNYPGVNADGMSSLDEAKRHHAAILKPADIESEAVGTIEAKPAKRTRKTGQKVDMTITQDWGVDHIDGYEFTSTRDDGGSEVKSAFIKEAKTYLNTIAGILAERGYSPYADKKGRPEKSVSVNEGGVAGSGDVHLTMAGPDGKGVYVTIGESLLRGVVPTTPSGVAVMFRVSQDADRYGVKDQNRWMPVDLSAIELADAMEKTVNASKPKNAEAVDTAAAPATNKAQEGETKNGQTDAGEQGPQALDEVAAGENRATESGTAVRGSRAGSRAGGKSRDRGLDEPGVSGTRSGGSGSTSVRAPKTGGRRGSGAVGAGRTGGSGSAAPEGNEGLERQTEAVSAANIQAVNFRIAEDVRLGQGGEVEKFRDNIAAIKALKAIESENRRATSAEQKTLARYVGWGGLANAFPNPETKAFKPEWDARGKELESLLTPKEYALARRSTLDSHYTSQTVVSAMWDAARHLGFKGGVVAETSMGVGNFLGLVPAEIQGNTKFVGIEYDSLTARLAGLLYPQETVLNSGIQDVPLGDGVFDMNIGNPPFGPQSLRFQFKPEFNGISIHNQFFLAGIDALKPGGLQINVVSRYLLDAMDKTTRTMLAKRAKLVGAIRLPDTAFKENARTSVVTDIIVLQRLTPEEQAEMEAAFGAAAQKPDTKNHTNESIRRTLAEKVPAWVETSKVPDPLGGEAMTVGAYFAANPDMILGTLERSGSMQFNNDITVRPGDTDLSVLLERAVAKLPQDVMVQQQSVVEASLARHKSMSDSLRIAITGQEAGSITIDADGVLQQVYERETPEGGYELAKRPITAASPWSESLMQNDSGKWFKLELALDADGKPQKQLKKDGQTKRNLNVYTRTVYASEADIHSSLLLGDAKYTRLRKMVELRDLMVAQINLETEDAPSAKMEANRAKLAAAYRAFVKEEGFISRPANASLVNNMPDGALVQALELSYRTEIDAAKAKKTGEKPRAEHAEPAPIMHERVIPKYEPATSAASPSDALAITLSESGRVDIARIADLLGKSEEEVIAEMHDTADKPLIFKDPEANAWVTRSDYLTGHVKRKLHAAQAARMQKNIDELEAVQPEPWGAEDVTALLGSTWIPPGVYAEFLEHITGTPATVRFSKVTNSFSVNAGRATQEKLDEFGTEGISIGEMVSNMLNSSSIRVTTTDAHGKTHVDAERTQLALLKAKAISNEFSDWVFSDSARRSTLVGIFNEQFNTRVSRQHDGSHLVLPGKVPDAIITMRRHQKNTIWRGISERFMLIDHVVGAGKTFTAIARAMERRRMGLSKKPTIVVPNHMVEQFTADVYRLYPGAKVLAAGKKDFEKIRRRRLFAKIASGDWDIVIIPHSSFAFIGISPETEERYLENELRIAEQAIKDAEDQAAEDGEDTGRRKPFNVKQAERLAEKISARMDAVKGRANKDRLLTFEQMGIDDMTVDEAHEFKNLFYSSRLTKVKGMGNRIGSQKAFDLYNKVRVLRESPQGAVTFMTGTPISNSAVEMYTMMRYLAADELNELGLEHFDAWRAQYVSTDPGWEPNETGRLTEVNRLGRSWSNMRSLMDLYYSFTDSVGNDQIKEAYAEDNNGEKFPIPNVKGGERRLVMSDPTPEQLGMLNETIKDFDGLPNIQDPYERNIARLKLMDRARKLSLDVRAAIPGHESKEVGGKLEKISDEVMRLYKQWDDDKGTQLVFLDRSVPKAKGDDKAIKVYDQLIAARDSALAAGNDEELSRVLEALDKHDANEIEELRAAQRGGWNAYQQIKDNLVAQGIPANEIRFVQEANNDAQKQALFDAVNAGHVRVLLGSTPRMGAGTNVQKRLIGLHHADVTWKPSDIEQREGRIIRQGNDLLQKYGIDNFEVEILAYATERTIDAKMWSLNSAKLKTINGIRKYDGSFSMDFEDSDSVGMAEIAALASGDPLLLERVKLTSEIDSLELLERQHRRKMWGFTSRVEDAEKAIKVAPARHKRLSEFAEILRKGEEALKKHADARSVTVEGKVYNTYMEAGAAITGHIAEQQAGDEEAKISVRVNDRKLTSKNGALDALHDALGDAGSPFLLEYDGKEIIGRTEAGRTLNKLLATIVADLEKRDSKVVDFGTMLGLKVEASIERGDSDAYYTSIAAVTDSGQTVQSVDIASEKTAPVTSSISAALSRLGGLLESEVYARDAQYAMESAERAKEELPGLREKVTAPFAQAAALAEKRNRLEEITAQLSGDNKTAAAPENDTGFSRADGLTDAEAIKRVVRVQGVVNGIKANWKNAPEIIVVADMQDARVPERVRDMDAEMKSNGASGEPRGFISGGKVYIVAGQHKSVADVVTTVAHETLGHAGLRGLYGEALNPILRQIVNMRRAEVNAKVKEYGFDPKSERDLLRAAEEVLANLAQTQPEMGFVKRAIAAIRNWLRDNGLRLLLTDADIIAKFILPARAFIENGRGPGGGGSRTTAFSRSSQTDSAAFKKWFGGSKVVDESGKPLVVYHGTHVRQMRSGEMKGDIRAFDRMFTTKFRPHSIDTVGSWFSTNSGADGAAMYAGGADGSMIYPVHLSIQNPHETTFHLMLRRARLLANGKDDGRMVGEAEVNALRKWLNDIGKDGIKIVHDEGAENGSTEFKNQDAWIALEPEQIKSAIGNRGSFDPANDDIMFSRTVEIRAAVSERAADLLTSQKTFNNWWHKSVGTQYHKAHIDVDFRKAFNAVQSYLSGMSAFANSSADLADRLIPQLNSIRDLWNTKPPSQADVKAISGPIFAGTLEDETVYGVDDLRNRFKLTDGQIDLYVQFRAAVDKSLDDLGKTDILRYAGADVADMRAAVLDAPTASRAALIVAKRLQELGKEDDAKVVVDKGVRVADLKAKGYAPLTRFGRYTLHVTEGDEQLYFSLFESEAEANAMAREMRADNPGATVTQGVLSAESYKLFNGLSPDTLELFAGALGVEKNEIVQEYIKLAKSNRDAMKRMIKRKGIAGFSEDVPRILASFITSNARQSATNVYGGVMEKAAEAIPKEKGDVKDEAIKMIEFARNPTEDAAKLRGMLFVQYIGGSVASAAVNLTQPITMSFPYLNQFSKRAGVELAKAMKQAAIGGELDADLKKALKRAEADGVVSPQEIHQLQAEAVKKGAGVGALARMFGVKGDTANKLDDLSKRGLFAWGSLFSLAEQFNRRSTFIAAYNIARQNKEADPFAFAEKAVVETQGIYNRGNRPDWARGAPGALIFTFKQYSISYMEFLKRLPPKERAIALAILVLAAGLQGIPFADDLDDLIDTLAQQMGYAWNTKAEKEKFAASILGTSGADFVLHGTSALPGFPLDFSGRLGMANLLPGTGILLKNKTDKMGEVLDVFGVAGGVVKDALRGEVLPIAVRNMLKSADMANTGMYRDWSGKKVIDTDGVDALMKGIGFQPAEVARESRAARTDMQDVMLVRNIESEIAADMAQGIFTKDKEAVDKAREKLAKWNANNPDKPIVITNQQIMARVKQMAMSRRDRLIKSAPKELRGGLVE